MDNREKILALEARIAELERLVGVLVYKHESTLPAIYGPLDHTPPLCPPPFWPTTPIVPNAPTINAHPRCQACGIELSPVMGYVCSRGAGCPTGLGGISCTVLSTGLSQNGG